MVTEDDAASGSSRCWMFTPGVRLNESNPEVLVNLLIDLLYTVLDPRIRY